MSLRTTSNPSSLACLACRSKHLKCDATQPTCGRCATNNFECIYVRSRRGLIGGRRRLHQAYTGNTGKYSPELSRTQLSSNGSALHAQQPVSAAASTPGSDETIEIDAQMAGGIAEGRLIDTFYSHVYPAHPFVIPRKLYKEEPDLLPQYLKRAIYFIARPLVSSCAWYNDSFEEIFRACSLSHGFGVQALILLTIGSYARGKRADGDRALGQAIETAYSIGLGSNNFNAGDRPILQESWRRTWWELYSIAGTIRVLTPMIPKVETIYSRLLPGPDTAYRVCQVAELRTLNQMQERHFAEDNFQYSSFAYRVEAVRILNNVLDFSVSDLEQPQLRATYNTCRASIRSYMLAVPKERRSGIRSDGETDELMFCALTLIELASLLLNLPRSKLPNARTFSTVCATKRLNLFSQDETVATISAMESADRIIQLLIDRLADSMSCVSPCFACVLAFAATTHLSAFCLGQEAERMSSLREYIHVSLSALDSMAQTWPIAKAVKGQLAEFSREILSAPQPLWDGNANHMQTQAQLEDFTSSLPIELVPGIQDDSWLQDLVNNDMEVIFA